MSPAARIGAILIVVLLAVALPILAAEMLLRMVGNVPRIPRMFVLDDRLGYRLEPSVRERARIPGIYDYRWTVNSQGFRGAADHAVPKPNGTRRVVMLGDSFTFGLGVDDDESYPARVQHSLETRCPTTPTDVVNAGVGGYGTSHAAALLEDRAVELQPDLIVYGFFTNDPVDDQVHGLHTLEEGALRRNPPSAQDMSRAKALVDKIPGYDWLIRNSTLVAWVRHQYFLARARRQAPGPSPDGTPVSEPGNLLLTQRLVERMAEVSKALSAPFLVALIPDSSAMRETMIGGTPSPQSALLDEMKQRCANSNLECIDLRSGLAALTTPTSWTELFIANEGHFSADGHDKTARLLAPRIAEALGCPTSAVDTLGPGSVRLPGDSR